MKKKKLLLLTVGTIFIVLSGYAYKSTTYQDQFLPNTRINGVKVGKMTAAEAYELLAKENTQQISVSVGKKEISSENTQIAGLEAIPEAKIAAELQKQNPVKWLIPSKKTIVIPPEVNQEKLNAYLTTIREKITELNAGVPQTKDAEIVFKDNTFVIAKEQEGATINVEAEILALEKAIKKGETSLTINAKNTKPSILEDNPDLQSKLAAANKVLNQSYTYVINGQELPIPKANIATMLQPNQPELVNSEAVAAYLSELGKTYNTSTNSTSFKSTRRGTIDVPAGTFSWTIDGATEAELLTQSLTNAQSFKRPPAYVGSTSPETALIKDTYIEVDLVNQHMWFYQNGALVLETDVVTGKPATPTPPGINYVWKKERNATLTGEDYASPVDYWMPIDWTGVGIHDSDWQSAYGGDRFVQYGSHGCVNTPPTIMKQLYETAEIGTPVIVF